MPRARTDSLPSSLRDLPPWVEAAEGFAPIAAALQEGQSATVDGAWNSSAALVAATLGLKAPKTLLIALAHPRALDTWAEDLVSFTGVRPHVFPAWDALPTADTVLDEIGGQRLRLLRQLEGDVPPRFLLTTMPALLQPVPNRDQLTEQRKRLRVGQAVELETLSAWLVEHGFQRMEAVEVPGEFSRRGGILDVYSPDAEAPYRLEFLGDELESIRQFAPDTQRSLGDLNAIEITAQSHGVQTGTLRGHLADYLPPGSWTMLVEPSDLEEHGKFYLERVADPTGLFSIAGVFQQLLQFPSVYLTALPSSSLEATCHLRVESVERFSGDVTKVKDELDTAAAGDLVLVACHNEAEMKRLGDVLASGQLAQSGRLRLTVGHVHAGFRLLLGTSASDTTGADLSKTTKGRKKRASNNDVRGIVVLGDHELFHREQVPTVLPRRQLESRASTVSWSCKKTISSFT